MERREFFLKLAALAGYTLIPIGCGDSSAPAVSNDNDSDPVSNEIAYSRQAFDNSINTTFSVEHNMYGVIDMMLQQVDDEVIAADTEQFSISLAGPETPLLTEGNYNVYNDTFGTIRLYLQPGEASTGKQLYRAVFSLLSA